MTLEQRLDIALMKLRSGRTQYERREAFAEMQRIKKEMAKDTAAVEAKERLLGLRA